jgi:hypothetical protein
MTLDGYDFVNGGAVHARHGLQLIEGFATDAAIPTVLEQQHAGDGTLQPRLKSAGSWRCVTLHGAATLYASTGYATQANPVPGGIVETGSLKLVARVRKEGAASAESAGRS